MKIILLIFLYLYVVDLLGQDARPTHVKIEIFPHVEVRGNIFTNPQHDDTINNRGYFRPSIEEIIYAEHKLYYSLQFTYLFTDHVLSQYSYCSFFYHAERQYVGYLYEDGKKFIHINYINRRKIKYRLATKNIRKQHLGKYYGLDSYRYGDCIHSYNVNISDKE